MRFWCIAYYIERAYIRELDMNNKTDDDIARQYIDEITKGISDCAVSEYVGQKAFLIQKRMFGGRVSYSPAILAAVQDAYPPNEKLVR